LAEQHLHIVSFDVPLPADYGGVIDVFHKIRHLSALGWSITLHCFRKNRSNSDELNRYCREVYYYDRDLSPLRLLSSIPFIAASRNDRLLSKRINRDKSPILLEGLHCCSLLSQIEDKDRTVIVRTHNIEHAYYTGLAQHTRNAFQRIYFQRESKKLKAFEHILAEASGLACISKSDESHFKLINPNTSLIGPFHANDSVQSREGKGQYMLYHGALNVSENQEAVRWLFHEFVPHTSQLILIAGKQPPAWMMHESSRFQNVRLIPDPDQAELDKLIRDAHIHILPAMQTSGVKLKLVNALFSGRHLLCNAEMVAGTGLDAFCHLAESGKSFLEKAELLMQEPFTANHILERKKLEATSFSNPINTERLSGLLMGL
jgi:hypothetical protein